MIRYASVTMFRNFHSSNFLGEKNCLVILGTPLCNEMASAQTDSADELSKLFEISWRPDER